MICHDCDLSQDGSDHAERLQNSLTATIHPKQRSLPSHPSPPHHLTTHSMSLGSLESNEGSRSSLTTDYWRIQLALHNGACVHSQTNTFLTIQM